MKNLLERLWRLEGTLGRREYALAGVIGFVLKQSGTFDPARILTQSTPLGSVLEAYERFDLREEGWIKVMLQPQDGD